MAALKRLPGFRPERLVAVIGPSIGGCCFEVGNDVYRLFTKRYNDAAFYKPSVDGKWKIDLQGIIQSELMHEGVPDTNIHNSGICTKCRNDLFFSHRGDNGKTGSLAAFMQINAII
jgi:copper oxidase (laccase) domain-containing protein